MKQVNEFKWIIVVFVMTLFFISNFLYMELPFIRISFIQVFPHFNAEFYPYSFQTLIAWSSGIILGGRKALIAFLIYISLGMLGLPLFASGGGLDYFKEPTFGYLIALPINAFLSGYLYKNLEKNTKYLFVCFPILLTHFIGIIYLLFFNPSLLDLTWHLSFSMIGYDLIFCFILIQVLPILSFFLNEITMQELINEPLFDEESFKRKHTRSL